jgi:hypothetical protein
VSQAVEALEAHPQAGMVYADGIMVDADLRILDRHRYRALGLLDLLSFEVLLQPTVFLRRTTLESVGYLDPSYHLILDHELWHAPPAATPSCTSLRMRSSARMLKPRRSCKLGIL